MGALWTVDGVFGWQGYMEAEWAECLAVECVLCKLLAAVAKEWEPFQQTHAARDCGRGSFRHLV